MKADIRFSGQIYGKSLSAVLAASLMAACAPANPTMMAPPEIEKGVAEQAAVSGQKIQLTPKVDILFVIDNSDSMKTHQENLKANIDKFVSAFERNTSVDFHIGVISIYDNVRWGEGKKFPGPFPQGELRPVQNPDEPGKTVGGMSFVTRAPRYDEILGQTLKIGTMARGSDKNDLGGPEFEEVFVPLMAALSPTAAPNANAGFLREDAHLAIVIMTDADDYERSPITPTQLDAFLYKLKGEDRRMYSTYAALSLSKKCPRDFGLRTNAGPLDPVKILELVKLTKGEAFDLCGDFGKDLARVGDIIEKRATSHVRIPLSEIPDIHSLNVKIGGREILPDQDMGWTYDPKNVAIVLNNLSGILQKLGMPTTPSVTEPAAKSPEGVSSEPTNNQTSAGELQIEFNAVTAEKMLRGRARRVGQ